MQCSGNGRKGFLHVFVFGKMLKAAKDVWQSRVLECLACLPSAAA